MGPSVLTLFNSTLHKGSKALSLIFHLAKLRIKSPNLSNRAPASGFVVAVTSFPARICSVHWTLRSLFLQKTVPEKVVLVLSGEEFPAGASSLPRNLTRFLAKVEDRVDLIFTTDNKRSYKKLLPALDAYPKHVIVTVDDDVIYPSNWFSSLLAAHKLFPDSIIGTRGAEISLENSRVAPYSNWKRAVSSVPSHKMFLTGRGGILYPPGSLSVEVTNWNLAKAICPTADDIWFKAMAALAGTKCMAVPIKSEYLPSSLFEREALWRANVLSGRNDEAVRRVFGHFGILEIVSREIT